MSMNLQARPTAADEMRMSALRRTAPGESEIRQIARPVPAEGEVLVRMLHAAVNPFDLQVLRGEIGADPERELTLGAEGVGTVDGALVQVSGGGLGAGRDGTFAPWVTSMPTALRPLPAGVDPRTAATVGVAGKTAWRAVHQLAEVGGQDTVLVLGATGGVGMFAAQLASSSGARVLAQTASEAKGERLRELGLEILIAASPADVVAALDGAVPSVVLDPLGGDYVAELLPHLATRARVVTYGVLAGRSATAFNLAAFYGRGIQMLGTSGGSATPSESAESLAGALDAIVKDDVVVDVDALPLHRAPEALRRLVERGVIGKLVLDL